MLAPELPYAATPTTLLYNYPLRDPIWIPAGLSSFHLLVYHDSSVITEDRTYIVNVPKFVSKTN